MPFSRNALFCECLHRSLDNSKSYLSIALKFCVQFYKCLSYILLFFWSLLWTFSNLTFFIKLSNFGKLHFFCFNLPKSKNSILLNGLSCTNVWNFKSLSAHLKEISGERQTSVTLHHFLVRFKFSKLKL